MTFSPGLEVYYKNIFGVVNFICDTYITITVVKGEHPRFDVNILVHKENWKQVKLVKESSK